jgi:hypothetical protein
MPQMPEDQQIALAELKILRDIIARHESREFRIKELFVAIIGGITVARCIEDSPFRPLIREYILLSLVASVGFWVVLLYHRAIVELATDRVRVVEIALKPKKNTTRESKKVYHTMVLRYPKVSM